MFRNRTRVSNDWVAASTGRNLPTAMPAHPLTEPRRGSRLGDVRGSMQGSGATRGRFGAVCSALAFAVLAIPAAASGDLIYVAPDDQSSGFFCSESQPCALVVGINLVADDGDEVLLAPDIYETSDELEVPATATGVTIRPRDPGTRAWINSTATTALQLSGGNATVRRISLTQNHPGGTGIFGLASGSRIENVVSISNGDTPCQIASGTIRDSICLAGGPSGRALRVSLGGGTANATIRNATLAAPNTGGTGIYASGVRGYRLRVARRRVVDRLRSRYRRRDGDGVRRLGRRGPGRVELRERDRGPRRDRHRSRLRRQPDRGADLHRVRPRAGSGLADGQRGDRRRQDRVRPTSTATRGRRAPRTTSARTSFLSRTSFPTRPRPRRPSRRSRRSGRARGARGSRSHRTSPARTS